MFIRPVSNPLKLVSPKIIVWVLLTMAAYAGPVTVTLNSNYPADYSFYSYTVNGTTYTDPVAPYVTTLSDSDPTDLISGVTLGSICYDINNDMSVGTAYTGSFAYNTDIATMQATYLANLLNYDGGTAAPVSVQGAISMAIWAIMFPSSNKDGGSTMTPDPAATAYENQAATAVSSGYWTVADSNLYPTFMPDDTAVQRLGLIFSTTAPLAPLPEPSSWIMLSVGLGALAIHRGHRVRE